MAIRLPFVGDLDFGQNVIEAKKPKPVTLQTRRRVNQLDPISFDPRLQSRQILRITAERQVMKPLTRAFDHPTPAMGIPERLKRKSITIAVNVKPEIAVEFLGD